MVGAAVVQTTCQASERETRKMKKHELAEIWISAVRRIAGEAVGGGNAGLHRQSEWRRHERLAAGKFIHQVVTVGRTPPSNADRNARHSRAINWAKGDRFARIRKGSRRRSGYPHWDAGYPSTNAGPRPVNDWTRPK
jgi:hypothetical protein